MTVEALCMINAFALIYPAGRISGTSDSACTASDWQWITFNIGLAACSNSTMEISQYLPAANLTIRVWLLLHLGRCSDHILT